MAEIIDLAAQARIEIIKGVLEHVGEGGAITPTGLKAIADALVLAEPEPFQDRAWAWSIDCFGEADSNSLVERFDRHFEEEFEFAQVLGYDMDRLPMIRKHVFDRPPGDPFQEVGGIMLTLASLCRAAGIDMAAAGEDELARVNRPEMLAKIRAKHDAKPRTAVGPATSPEDIERLEGLLADAADHLRSTGNDLHESAPLVAEDMMRVALGLESIAIAALLSDLRSERTRREAAEAKLQEAYESLKQLAHQWNGLQDLLGDAEAEVERLKVTTHQLKSALPDCRDCGGSGRIVVDAVTTGRNQHSGCEGPCDRCEGLGVEL